MLEANQVLDLGFWWEFSQKKKELKGIFQTEQDPEFKQVEKTGSKSSKWGIFQLTISCS